MSEPNPLTTAPIPKLIRTIAIPACIGFFFNTMYNVVDTYFGGLHSTEALAALSLSFPVFFIFIAIGSGISGGLTALIANALGAGSREKASRYIAQGLSFGVIVSVFLTILGLSTAPFLFRILGATESYLSLALSYMNVIMYGTIGFIFVFFLNGFLSAIGNTKAYRNFLITGFFLNFIFNTWFMFGGLGVPALGLSGVALGTVVVQIIGIAYLGYKVREAHLIGKALTWNDLKPDWSIYRDILAQGLPGSFGMMTVALGIFIITYFISIFGEGAVAAYGIATRIEQITLLPLIGLNIAVLTLIGQNYGAKRFDRVREVYRTALRYGAALSLIATVFLFAVAGPLMKVFTADATIILTGVIYLRIAAFVAAAYMILFMSDAAMRGMKRPLFFLWLGIARQIVLPALVFTVLIRYLHTGIIGIWWVIVAIAWSAALVALWFVRRILSHISA